MLERNVQSVYNALKEIGGKGTLNEIYGIVLKDENFQTYNYEHPESAIRSIIRRYSSDSTEGYSGGIDLFYSVKGLGQGTWGIRDISEVDINKKELKEDESEYGTELEKEMLTKIRIGQGRFRDRLLEIDVKCRVCGVCNEAHLIASHIKPWKDSDHVEKLDTDNGLLLCPNHDSLFDKGYISFNDDGSIIISDKLSKSDKLFLNVNKDMHIDLNEREKNYMKYHRENVFEKF